MAKSRREIQKEIYDYIAEQDCPVIQQTILEVFSNKYSTSTRTISRILDQMINSKNPFHLRTWYDKNRYYDIPTITIRGEILSVLSIGVPIAMFFVDLYNFLNTQWHIFIATVFFVVGFWIAMWISVIPKKHK